MTSRALTMDFSGGQERTIELKAPEPVPYEGVHLINKRHENGLTAVASEIMLGHQSEDNLRLLRKLRSVPVQ